METAEIETHLLDVFKSAAPECDIEKLEYASALIISEIEEHKAVTGSVAEDSIIEIITESIESCDVTGLGGAESWHFATTIADWLLTAIDSRNELENYVGQTVLAVLSEDGEWHEALLKAIKEGEGGNVFFDVEFSKYGKPQVVTRDNIRFEDEIARDEDESGSWCPVCERSMPLTKHHLIPRTTHDANYNNAYSATFLNTTVGLCRPCHSAVHRIENEETLAKEFNTLEKLLFHPRVQEWAKYAHSQREVSRDDALKQLRYRR